MDPKIQSERALRSRRHTARRRGIACIAFGLACSWVAYAAVVSMQQPARTGGMIETPVLLYSDDRGPVSGIVFDVHYDPTRFELVGITPGVAAADAGKEIVVSAPQAGSGRVLITGFNDTALYDGHVATIVLRPLQAGTSPEGLMIDRALATDPFGNAVDLEVEDLLNDPPDSPDKIAEPREEEDGVEEPRGIHAGEGSPESADSVSDVAEATDSALERSTASGAGAPALDDPAEASGDPGLNAASPRAPAAWVAGVGPDTLRPSRPAASPVRPDSASARPGVGVPAPAAGSGRSYGGGAETDRAGAYRRAPETEGPDASVPPEARLALAAPIPASPAPVATDDAAIPWGFVDSAAYPRRTAMLVSGAVTLLFLLLLAGRAGNIGSARRGRR